MENMSLQERKKKLAKNKPLLVLVEMRNHTFFIGAGANVYSKYITISRKELHIY